MGEVYGSDATEVEKRLNAQIERATQRFAREGRRTRVQTTALTRRRSNSFELETGDEGTRRADFRRASLSTRDGLALERIIGESDLLSTNYLERAVLRKTAVARVHVRSPRGEPEGYGTSFLVGPSLLLTNEHVLPDERSASGSLVEFHYEDDLHHLPKATRIFTLEPERFFYANIELDFALVAVAPMDLHGGSLSDIAPIRLIRESGKALIGEPVSIIQHPNGGSKRVALRNNEVVSIEGNAVHYVTDTEPGSSGSPVFNDQWEVVALHHAGVPERTPSGRVKRDAHGNVIWIANEGIRISRIFAHLEGRAWKPDEAPVLRSMGAVVSSIIASEDAETEQSTKAAALPEVRTFADLQALMRRDDITERQLRPYAMLDPNAGDALAPAVVVRPELRDETLEADLAVGIFNRFSRRYRRRQYRRKIRRGGPDLIKVVSEGDSWFQYPVLLDDVIDYLIARPQFAVFSVGAAGDLLRDMVQKGEQLDAIADKDPDVFLISGGGNDLFGDGRLATLVPRFAEGRPAKDYVGGKFDAFRDELRASYHQLFSQVRAEAPALPIICHSYSYPIPKQGRWLGKPLASRGITDPELQRDIVAVMLDRLKGDISSVAAEYSRVTFLDVIDVVLANGWHDELHPNETFYAKVGQRFEAEIKSVLG
ncbi:MAG: trypsin-like peptidase domain-containing protein [Myxococcota bacterium]